MKTFLPHFAFPFFSYYFIIITCIYFRRLCHKELEGCKRTVWNWKVWKRLAQDILFKSVEMCQANRSETEELCKLAVGQPQISWIMLRLMACEGKILCVQHAGTRAHEMCAASFYKIQLETCQKITIVSLFLTVPVWVTVVLFPA